MSPLRLKIIVVVIKVRDVTELSKKAIPCYEI
jgi:hypothetical protein